MNVLLNDSDPDGDTLVLQSITAPSGSVTFDPSGQVSYTPDPTSPQGQIELEYTVADGFGATATGAIRVEIRLDGSNNEPDARNDSGVTVAGKAITFNVLANDTDPDNDPLSLAGQPTLLSPTDVDPSSIEMSISPDGELFFVAQNAGSLPLLVLGDRRQRERLGTDPHRRRAGRSTTGRRSPSATTSRSPAAAPRPCTSCRTTPIPTAT